MSIFELVSIEPNGFGGITAFYCNQSHRCQIELMKGNIHYSHNLNVITQQRLNKVFIDDITKQMTVTSGVIINDQCWYGSVRIFDSMISFFYNEEKEVKIIRQCNSLALDELIVRLAKQQFIKSIGVESNA